VNRYQKSAAERIFGRYLDLGGQIGNAIEFFDDGARISRQLRESDHARVLLCHPANELEGLADVPDPLEDPNLPIPFTARELAAFMVDGIGAMLPEVYGDWTHGPDEEMLEALGADAGRPRQALREAYAVMREALSAVGQLNSDLQRRAAALEEGYEQANLAANEREGVVEPHLQHSERNARRARARESVAHLDVEARTVARQARAEYAKWRKAIVQHIFFGATTTSVEFGGLSSSVASIESSSNFLATPEELVAAFGPFTGMNLGWFRKLGDTPALERARRVPGQGGRAQRDPLFHPYEVMTWLADPKRKKGRPLPVETAWRRFREYFPSAYRLVESVDPTQD